MRIPLACVVPNLGGQDLDLLLSTNGHFLPTGILAGLENTGWAITQGLSSSFVGILLDWGSCEQEGATGPMSEADTASCDLAWRTAFGLAAALYIGQGIVFAIWGSSEPIKVPAEAKEQTT